MVTKKRRRVAMDVWVAAEGTYAEKTFSPEKNNRKEKQNTERYVNSREQELERSPCESEHTLMVKHVPARSFSKTTGGGELTSRGKFRGTYNDYYLLHTEVFYFTTLLIQIIKKHN